METREAPASVVDCTGLPCPTPVIRTAQAIRDIEPGQLLEVVATDPSNRSERTTRVAAAWSYGVRPVPMNSDAT